PFVSAFVCPKVKIVVRKFLPVVAHRFENILTCHDSLPSCRFSEIEPARILSRRNRTAIFRPKLGSGPLDVRDRGRNPTDEQSRRVRETDVGCCVTMTPIVYSCSIRGRLKLWQRRIAHQISIAFAGGAAAFVDGPDDQALAATHVAGGEYAGDAGGEPAVLGLGVRARVFVDAKLIEELIFRAGET